MQPLEFWSLIKSMGPASMWMAELRIQPRVTEFVEREYGGHGLRVLKKAVEELGKQLEWCGSAAEVQKRMDGGFDVEGANVLKKYVNGPQQAWRMAVKQVGDEVYAVEMFAAKKDEDLLLRKLQERF